MSRMLVTPEQALLWLSKNYKNRPLNESVVAEYERKIRAGEWRERGGIPIIITPSGELRNGQHRLTALVRAGLPLVLNVCVHEDKREIRKKNPIPENFSPETPILQDDKQ